jgi:hypothetical protein
MPFESKNSGTSPAGQAGPREQSEPLKNKRRPRRRYVGAAEISLALERQHRLCALTGWALSPSTAAADFIVPLSRGGKPVPENVRVLHVDVKAARGHMLDEEFLRACRAVVAAADARQPGSASA